MDDKHDAISTYHQKAVETNRSLWSYRTSGFRRSSTVVNLGLAKSNRATSHQLYRRKNKIANLKACRWWREASDGTEQLVELGLGLGVHADGDDEGNKAIVSDHLGLLHRPGAPLLEALARRPLLRPLGALPGLPLPLERHLRRHGS
ncbi:unnamed protein product, partial [Musa acuminata subsp. burmannicoides]